MGSLNRAPLFVLPAPPALAEEDRILAMLAGWAAGLAGLPAVPEWPSMYPKGWLQGQPPRDTRPHVLYMVESRPDEDDQEEAFYRNAMDNAGRIQRRFDAYSADLVICCGEWAGNAFPDLIEPFRGHGENRVTSRGIPYVTARGRICLLFPMPDAPVPGNILFYALLDATREALARNAGHASGCQRPP
ncbi:MAG: hypothetical protein Q9M27_06980 [Mariprofundaceae bacterium]|nr:hypothetical protein [Mariprofundaceae bacterium]